MVDFSDYFYYDHLASKICKMYEKDIPNEKIKPYIRTLQSLGLTLNVVMEHETELELKLLYIKIMVRMHQEKGCDGDGEICCYKHIREFVIGLYKIIKAACQTNNELIKIAALDNVFQSLLGIFFLTFDQIKEFQEYVKETPFFNMTVLTQNDLNLKRLYYIKRVMPTQSVNNKVTLKELKEDFYENFKMCMSALYGTFKKPFLDILTSKKIIHLSKLYPQIFDNLDEETLENLEDPIFDEAVSEKENYEKKINNEDKEDNDTKINNTNKISINPGKKGDKVPWIE
ncbi:hypothetical protein TCON_0505 [Astathelohania contejeani]|uniref:Uncharacterized protein n=1 Tax=Astathelohania contejeani TaxID=164912 RepID=A0ABQ7I1F5_9MICR|nr:hypothetical protein TCON_0505 [Thelohania contejeani]